MLVAFRSTRVPGRFADDASRRSTLYSLTGPIPSLVDKSLFTELLNQKVHQLLRVWRQRLIRLKDAEWSTVSNDRILMSCRNCYPTFMCMEPISSTCKQYICPFCHGRVTQDLYKNISKLSKELEKNDKPNWILGFRHTSTLNLKKITLKDAYTYEARRRNKFYKNLGFEPLGGYLASHIEPVRHSSWKLTRTGIFITDAGISLHNARKWASKIKRLKAYEGRKLAKLVGWTLKYPIQILESNRVEDVALMLNAKGRTRLSATYGILRSKT